MKKLFPKKIFILFAVLTILSCSKDDSASSNTILGGDAFRMQMVTIDLPNTTLSESEYHGSIGAETVIITKSDEHTLIFMMPSSAALGNQNLVFNDLNDLTVTYNVKDVVLPDTAAAVVSPLQSNFAAFQSTTSMNTATQNAINSYNQAFTNASEEDKIKMASFYYANKTLFDDLVLNDYSNIAGRNIDGTMLLLQKHKAAALSMAIGVYIVVYSPEPLEKVAGAVFLGISAWKAFEFGAAFVTQNVNSINFEMDNTQGENNRSILSGLQLQNDVARTVSFKTVDRTVITSDSSKSNIGAKLFFTYNAMFNGFVEQVNPVLQWINNNVPFCNFNLMTPEPVPTSSATVKNLIDPTTFSHLTLTTDPNIILVSKSLTATGQLNIKVKAADTSATFPINSAINYSYTDEFSTFSGTLPLIISNTSAPSITGQWYIQTFSPQCSSPGQFSITLNADGTCTTGFSNSNSFWTQTGNQFTLFIQTNSSNASYTGIYDPNSEEITGTGTGTGLLCGPAFTFVAFRQ